MSEQSHTTESPDPAPKAGERWRRKTDHTKVLTVDWTNCCGYVQFRAPWMKRRVTCCGLESFRKRYERA